MVGAHTRTLTMKPLGVPANRRTFLMLLMKLDNIHATVAVKALLNYFVEPGDGRLPALVLSIPLRLMAPFAAEPSVVISGEWNAN